MRYTASCNRKRRGTHEAFYSMPKLSLALDSYVDAVFVLAKMLGEFMMGRSSYYYHPEQTRVQYVPSTQWCLEPQARKGGFEATQVGAHDVKIYRLSRPKVPSNEQN